MGTVKLCRHCREYKTDGIRPGYYYDEEIKRPGKCPKCFFGKLEDTGIDKHNLITILYYSKDPDFFDYMMDLNKNDPEKYQSEYDRIDKEGTERLQQKNKQRAEERRQKEALEKIQAEKNTPRCPKCGCTNIQLVPRKWSLATGFMTNKVDRMCVNCKYKF